MNHKYKLDITENDQTTSIIVISKLRPGPGTQVTTADKGDHAMVYVWGEVNFKLEEHVCENHTAARNKAWEVARRIGEQFI